MNKSGVIVVGVDGSAAARAALDLAIEEGLTRGVTVEVVTAWVWASPYEGLEHADTFEEARAAAEKMQDELIQASVDRLADRPVISQTVVHDYPGKVLVERARNARMIVVGHGRKGPIARTLLGSVSEYCVRHSSAPVLVVPDPTQAAPAPDADLAEAGHR